MKKLASLLLAMALPLAAVAQNPAPATPAAPKKNVLSSYRIAAKPGHTAALKAALATHAEKFHKGDQAWRVGEILSGPDGGMFHIVEGPTSWTTLDDRGDLGAEHMKDYETNIAPHVEKSTPDTFATYQASLSTVPAMQWSNKVISIHCVVKPGRGSDTTDTLKKWKAIYEKRGFNVAVWHSAWSGDDSYTLAFRLPNGLKDLDAEAPSLRKICDELFGVNEYARLQQAAADNYSRVWSEMIEFKPELGSK